jgi:ATP-dependent protease ClpP protease subunit
MFDYDTDTGEVWIYDVIGPGEIGFIDFSALKIALDSMGGRDVTLRISSPGGSVGHAVDMYNAVKRYSGRVVASVDSLAASAASFLMLAAHEVRAAKNSRFMIHQASTITLGDVDEHTKAIGALQKADDIIVGMYVEKTGKPEEDIRAAMKAETWFNSAEALEYGLIDAIGDESDVVAMIPKGWFAKAPADLLGVQPEAGSRTPYPALREAARIKAKIYS